MSSGEQPPGGGAGDGPKKKLPSATIIGLTPLDKLPAAPAPPAPAAPAAPTPAPVPAAPTPAPVPAAPAAPAGPRPASPSQAPPLSGAKRSTLPPPIRGTAQSAPLIPPRAPAPPTSPPPSAAPPSPVPGAISGPHSAPTAAPIYEQPSGPTAPFGAATGPHAAPRPGAPHAPHGSADPHAPYSSPTSGPHAAPTSGPHAPYSSPTSGPHAPPPGGSHAPYSSSTAPSFPPPATSTAPSFPPPPTSTSPSFPPAPSAPSHPPASHEGGWGGGAGDVPPGSSFDSIEAPGSKFVAFLKISARRAFRLRIEPSEVLPSERRVLENSYPPILDRNLQAFLAWRRSVLFLVASALIPLTIIGVIDALQSRKFTPIFFVRGAPALAEGIFAWVCWSQLKKWSSWRQQRRKLFIGWLIFMLMPFVVFVYPLRTIFEDLGGTSREKLLALGVEGAYRQAVMPFVFAMLAMLQLAPKAISLMPGLIRASLVIKLLFPGSSAPGWLMVVAAPLYALLAYVILIIPYQFTGSGWFIAGVLGVIAAQSVLARAGFALAKPMDEAEALRHIKRVRTYYMGVMLFSAVLIIVALGSLVGQLNLRATDVITAVMKFEANVLILTMIGADLVVTNLDRARGYTAGRGHVEAETEVKIAAFVSLDAPSTPPPSGPAQ